MDTTLEISAFTKIPSLLPTKPCGVKNWRKIIQCCNIKIRTFSPTKWVLEKLSFTC